MRARRLALFISLALGLCLSHKDLRADEERSFRDLTYVVDINGSLGLNLHSSLPSELKSFSPAFGGGFGIRYWGFYETTIEYSHRFFGSDLNPNIDIGALDLTGLRFNYSPYGFKGWAGGARAGWVQGAIAPGVSTSSLLLGVHAGYIFELTPHIELRPGASLDLIPITTPNGREFWPMGSAEIHFVFKSDSLVNFFANLIRPVSL